MNNLPDGYEIVREGYSYAYGDSVSLRAKGKVIVRIGRYWGDVAELTSTAHIHNDERK